MSSFLDHLKKNNQLCLSYIQVTLTRKNEANKKQVSNDESNRYVGSLQSHTKSTCDHACASPSHSFDSNAS